MHLDYLELLEFMSGPKKDDDAIVYLLLSVKLIAVFARESPQTLFTRIFTNSQTRRSLAPILSTAKLDADLLYIIRLDKIGKRFT